MGTSGDHQGAHSLSDREIECRLVELHVSDAGRAAERYSLLTEADRRGIGKAHGYSSVAQWYSKNTRCTEGSVQHLVDLGAWLREHPTVADALAASDIHAGHTSALHDAYRTIAVADPALDEGTLRVHLATLLEVALHTTQAVSRTAPARSSPEQLPTPKPATTTNSAGGPRKNGCARKNGCRRRSGCVVNGPPQVGRRCPTMNPDPRTNSNPILRARPESCPPRWQAHGQVQGLGQGRRSGLCLCQGWGHGRCRRPRTRR